MPKAAAAQLGVREPLQRRLCRGGRLWAVGRSDPCHCLWWRAHQASGQAARITQECSESAVTPNRHIRAPPYVAPATCNRRWWWTRQQRHLDRLGRLFTCLGIHSSSHVLASVRGLLAPHWSPPARNDNGAGEGREAHARIEALQHRHAERSPRSRSPWSPTATMPCHPTFLALQRAAHATAAGRKLGSA